MLERTGGQQRVAFCAPLSATVPIHVYESSLCLWVATFLTLIRMCSVWIQHAGLVVAKQLVFQAWTFHSPPDGVEL